MNFRQLLTIGLTAGVVHTGQAWAGPACDKAVSDVATMTFQAKARIEATKLQLATGQANINDPALIRRQDDQFRSTIASMVGTLRKGCQPGDVISVEWGAVVKQVCDFNKSMVTNSSSTMCVLRGG